MPGSMPCVARCTCKNLLQQQAHVWAGSASPLGLDCYPLALTTSIPQHTTDAFNAKRQEYLVNDGS